MSPVWYKSRKKYTSIHYYNAEDQLVLKMEVDTSLRHAIFSTGAREELITFENLIECCSIEIAGE